MADTKPSGSSKSRTGCSECKRKRVKCDEIRPTCSRCSKYPERCSYALKLSWTQGRPFKKPRTNAKPWVINLNEDDPKSVTNTPDEDSTGEGSSVPGRSQPEPVINQEISTEGQNFTESTTVDFPESQSSSGFNSFQVTTESHEDDVFQPCTVVEDVTGIEDLVVNTPDMDDLELVDEVVERNDMLVPWQSTVPQSLSTYPLLCPSEPPSAYFFLHHYITHTSGTLFPLLAPSIHQDVLSIASETPHLLSAALAISCDQYRRLIGNDSMELRNRHNFFSRKAIVGLRQAMDDPSQASSFSTICTVLFLCTNEVMAVNTEAMRTHLRGAEHLLSLSIGQSRRASVSLLDERQLFLIRWFAVVEVFSNIMSLDKASTFEGRFWSVESPIDGSAQYVDEFVGFSLDLMPILARIGRMARLKQRRRALGPSLDSAYAEMADDLDMLLADNILLTEQQLGHLFSRASSPSLEHGQDPILALEAQYTHQMFVHASLIHLYRRVQELPRPDPKPAHALVSILELFGKLRPESPANILILWPLFTAGCEAEGPELREQIEQCMCRLRNTGWGNVDAGFEAIKTYWAEGNGERWDVFLERRGFDIVLF